MDIDSDESLKEEILMQQMQRMKLDWQEKSA